MTQTMTAPVAQAQPTYEISEDDKKRQLAIALAWKAYNGELDPPLKKMEGEADDNVLTNRCQAIVDRGVDFLFGKELEISVDEGAPQEAQDYLDKAWGRKETRVPLLQKLAMNGAMGRSAFLRIVPSTSQITQATTYRLIPVDPAIVNVRTAPQDCDTVLLYCLQYSTAEKLNGTPKTVYYREEISRIDPDGNASEGKPDDDDTWRVQHWTCVSQKGAEPKPGDWTAEGPPIVWNYPFSPLFACQNLPRPNDFWGTADITPDLIGLNNALNLVQSSVNRTQKIYGNPILYATDTGEGYIEIRPGEIIKLPVGTSKIDAVHIVSEVPSALLFAADLRSDIDEQSSVPGVATGRISTMPRGNLSGVAIELLHSPLMKKTDKKQCLYGELIIDVSKALLILNGMSGDIEITLAWQSGLPHDDLAAVQAAVSKKELDISTTTLQRELGYDPDEEQALSDAEDAQKLAKAQAAMAVFPPEVPGAPLLPGQPPPPKPGAPAAPGTPPTAIGGGKP